MSKIDNVRRTRTRVSPLSPSAACGCGGHLHANAQTDPTRTKTLRNTFARDVRKRFTVLESRIAAALSEDVFGFGAPAVLADYRNRPPGDRLEAFSDWLEEQEEETVLERSRAPFGLVLWTSLYIDAAYKAGLRHAVSAVRRIGVPVGEQAVSAPVHAAALGNLQNRAFLEVQGAVSALNQRLVRLASQNMLTGGSTASLVAEMKTAVRDVMRRRAILTAHTEVVRAHHIATMETYRVAGIEEVEALVEFNTAGDARVCPICAGLNGNTYTLDEAWSLLPVHPLCRCVMLPALPKEK